MRVNSKSILTEIELRDVGSLLPVVSPRDRVVRRLRLLRIVMAVTGSDTHDDVLKDYFLLKDLFNTFGPNYLYLTVSKQ